MYTTADLANIGIDILGTIGVFLINHIDEIAVVLFAFLLFYGGMQYERKRDDV